MNFEEQLTTGLEGVVVVMGIGNPLRGDDAAGSLAARRIDALPGVCVIDAQDVPEEFLVRVVDEHPDTVVLIDSVDMDATPGSVAFLDRDQIAAYCPSTHRMPISTLMGILEQETHARVIGIGIQPAHAELLKPLSGAVAASVDHVADMLNSALARGRTAAREVEGEVPA